MPNAPQSRPVPHRRGGLTAVVAGIAALGGAGTLVAVLPPDDAPVHHPVAVADAAVGLPASSGTTTPGTAGRTRSAALVAGTPPVPSPITSVWA